MTVLGADNSEGFAHTRRMKVDSPNHGEDVLRKRKVGSKSKSVRSVISFVRLLQVLILNDLQAHEKQEGLSVPGPVELERRKRGF